MKMFVDGAVNIKAESKEIKLNNAKTNENNRALDERLKELEIPMKEVEDKERVWPSIQAAASKSNLQAETCPTSSPQGTTQIKQQFSRS